MTRVRRFRIVLVFSLLLIVVGLVWQFQYRNPQPETLSTNALAEAISSNRISRVIVHDNSVEVIFLDGSSAITSIDPDEPMIPEQPYEFDLTPKAL